ncbi:hypothetical protein B0181_02210 [Moraxella caviae]|uniref:DUF669 domain-containing protein n=1 Tax=Moraxella caviae TaxID=34060 RepID=A0A1T0A9Z6_9GAMM|nr:hypothetical protein [Moraxella caviae]OOR92111.1 hypothetical protein B0181_02210 [Moraxella caviae]STZ14471.1 Uncharacterised protein [Moraxella caviae]
MKPIVFNQQEALKVGASNFIAGNTKQKVKIIRAEFVQSKSGAQGVELEMVNQDRQHAFHTYWYEKANGEIIDFQYQQLQALMGILGVQVLTPTQGVAPKYNWESRQTVQAQGVYAPELTNRIFTALFIRNFQVYNGEKRTKTEIYAAFSDGELSYREINAGVQTPQDIDAIYKQMLVKSERLEKQADDDLHNTVANQQANNQFAPQAVADDDVPF